ncbi:unnamed protein product [Knipowitschia caucasica]|uniref:C2H2-type domain-containing protein n=1 Tax=Knipowitschia caucasica TaxID=637954 RepID=A0AAV2JST2_KNICA
MSFPGTFSSQLTAVMEALLQAVVAQVTALVEDGALELRLELRDRDREILERQRDLELRDREILQLRAAVEELRARGEEAVMPAEETAEEGQSCGQVWTKEDPEPVVKCEPIEETTDQSVWPPSPLPSSTTAHTTATAHANANANANATATATTEYNDESSSDSTHRSHLSEHLEPADLTLDSLLNINHQFYYQHHAGFSLLPNLSHVQDGAYNFSAARRSLSASYGGFRCDQCGKTFTVKWRLISHQSVHTGAKPFSCSKCGTRFSRRDSCVRHEKKACCKDSLLRSLQNQNQNQNQHQNQRLIRQCSE